jgi:hypothetical protein
MIDPRDVVVPILGTDRNGVIQAFLGTGSFVGGESWLLTADYVIRDWTGGFAIVSMHDVARPYVAVIVSRDTDHDLVLLSIEGYRPVKALSLEFEKPFHSNLQMVTFEYGTTIVAGGRIKLSPATRVGNMTRMPDLTDRLGAAGDAALAMSFPAPRRAGGAPVLLNDGTFGLCGVIVANVSYHLLPAQIESVLDESNTIFEETHFMLPQAVTVNIRHLQSIHP